MFDVRPGSKETLGFVVVSSHQGRAFLCGIPPSNKKWKDKYVSIKFPLAAFPFAQNVWGKRMKRQVKPREADDLVAWETTLRARDASTRGLYNVGKWGVYPSRETDPEPEIILAQAIPNVIPIRQVRGSNSPVSATAGPSRLGKKKGKGPTLPPFSTLLYVNYSLLRNSHLLTRFYLFVSVVKFSSKFATPKPIDEEPSTVQPLSQPFSLDEQPAQSHQGTSQPIHSGELYINVDTMEFENMLGETGYSSEG
ncbi:unnamed protein product [Cuscuta campestris]|uniref:Uncharacterized protein n=1 Tax=Cuscuta campestris TaxID=132261 RepID=A0A484NNS5_9ASTE|nr:unnamed protein product [Cuscuta campestris]